MGNIDNHNDISGDRISLDTIKDLQPELKLLLINAGIISPADIVVRGPAAISRITGIRQREAIKLCGQASIALQDAKGISSAIVSAASIKNIRRLVRRIPTGSKNLDSLLGGGIETGAVTELYGEFGTGKTQICHALCVTNQLTVDQNEESSCKSLYIDAENTFRPERIESIAIAKGLDPAKALENVVIAKAYNSSHLQSVFDSVVSVVNEHQIRLIIVDSLISHYRAEYKGLGTLAMRQQDLSEAIQILSRTAQLCHVAVVVTNQVQSRPGATTYGDGLSHAGGHIMAHGTTYRILLKHSQGSKRIARMLDSPCHAQREALFALTDEGISDPAG